MECITDAQDHAQVTKASFTKRILRILHHSNDFQLELEEIFRILKPGGVCINSFSNRCFPSKVVNIWLRTNDTQHMAIVGNYFSSTNFTNINAYDISPSPGRSDPLYIVQAVKKKEQEEASENDKKDVVKNNL